MYLSFNQEPFTYIKTYHLECSLRETKKALGAAVASSLQQLPPGPSRRPQVFNENIVLSKVLSKSQRALSTGALLTSPHLIITIILWGEYY